MYRIAFFFKPNVQLSPADLDEALRRKGEMTFKVRSEGEWFHQRYESSVTWSHDMNSNIFTALVAGGEAVRTCGSLVEWMLRNAPDYLDEGPVGLQGVSVFG
jgi:hypothetical protein